MPDNSSNNKRIVKNTLFLYLRMMFVMGVSLYTSRVILEHLGAVDYGLYNVVGGIVALFTFVSAAMGNSTSRYITYEIGAQNQYRLNQVFNVALRIHIALALIIVILSETVGLWFLCYKMNIPADRFFAAKCVFQVSILTTAISIINVPFYSSVIAHERMNVYACISIFDVVAKLIVVYLLTISSFDKLIFYALLILIIQILDILIYSLYCRFQFREIRLSKQIEKSLLKEMTNFAGWSIIGNIAWVGYTQGLNILLNLFFGPSINAARALAVQVQGAVRTFVTNFQTAVNPQITKSYAVGEISRELKLVFSSSRLSYYLMFCIALPIIIEADYILNLWLVDVPEYSVVFLRLILIITLIDTIERPMNTAMLATGNIKKYQIISCSIVLMIIPVSYIALAAGYPPETVFVCQFVFMLLSAFIEIVMVSKKLDFCMELYIKKVVIKILFVTILSSITPLLLYYSMLENSYSFVVVTLVSILSVGAVSLLFGIEEYEKYYLKKYIGKILKNNRKN